MSEAHPITNTSINYNWVAALVVVLLALVAGSGLFFAVESGLNSAVSTPLEAKSLLENDADDDGGDGITDSTLRLASVLLSIPLRGGGLLLSLCELLKPGSEYCPTLERPG